MSTYIGDVLSAVGTGLQNLPNTAFHAGGRMLSYMGDAASATEDAGVAGANAGDGSLAYEAGRIASGMAGSAAATAALIAYASSSVEISLFVGALCVANPLLGLVVLAGGAAAAGYLGGEAGEEPKGFRQNTKSLKNWRTEPGRTSGQIGGDQSPDWL